VKEEEGKKKWRIFSGARARRSPRRGTATTKRVGGKRKAPPALLRRSLLPTADSGANGRKEEAGDPLFRQALGGFKSGLIKS